MDTSSDKRKVIAIGAGVAILALIMMGIVVAKVVRLSNVIEERSERAIGVLERTEKRVDEVLDVIKPLAKETVLKGVETISEIDAKDLGKGAQEGIKKVGGAARDRAVEYFKGRKD